MDDRHIKGVDGSVRVSKGISMAIGDASGAWSGSGVVFQGARKQLYDFQDNSRHRGRSKTNLNSTETWNIRRVKSGCFSEASTSIESTRILGASSSEFIPINLQNWSGGCPQPGTCGVLKRSFLMLYNSCEG